MNPDEMHSSTVTGRWCLDSGASSHMCFQKNKFSHLKPTGVTILNLANKESIRIDGSGTIKFETKDGFPIRLQKVLYVPDLRFNLLSVARITQSGLDVTFSEYEAKIVDPKTERKLMTARCENGIYHVIEYNAHYKIIERYSMKDWHERFGHLSAKILKKTENNGKVLGLHIKGKQIIPTCKVCTKDKKSQETDTKSNSKTSEILELIHSKICGPMRVKSLTDSRYFVTFIDDKTKWCQIYFLKRKSEFPDKFKDYKSATEKRTGRKVKILRSDNGAEYTGRKFTSYLKREGIEHQLIVEYTLQQSSVAEQKNHILVNMARWMMIQSGLSASFWAEAMLTSNHIRNRSPFRSLSGGTPFKLWTGKIPNVHYFQKFGAVTYILDKKTEKDDFAPNSKKGLFIGYLGKSKGYKLWDFESQKIIRSRDVIFTNSYHSTDDYSDFSYQ